eukprot:gene11266-12446_t
MHNIILASYFVFVFVIGGAATATARREELLQVQNHETTSKKHVNDIIEDILLPYSHYPAHTDIKRNHRYVRECEHIKHSNATTYEVYQKHISQSNATNTSADILGSMRYLTSRIEERKSVLEIDSRYVHGHIAVVNNPLQTFSIIYPNNKLSCDENFGERDSVSTTARSSNCIVATNAGFFNTHTGGCLGNIISNGHLVHNSGGIQNANFGIRKDGSIITGYLPEDVVTSTNFLQLVSGVGWLIRNGEIYVNESKKAECADTEETGTISRFFDVISARTAIGHDKHGRIMLAHIDGKTDKDGVNLLEFAELLKRHGAVNAINLDGGGSSTFVVNGTVINYPSDSCGTDYSCERKVSTIICIHEPAEWNPTEHNQSHKEAITVSTKHIISPDANVDKDSVAVMKYKSFTVVWFVALGAFLGCSLLGNVYLLHILRSRRETTGRSWNKSDLQSLLEEDSDGV